MGKQNPNTDPLGILKENGKAVSDPLGILKKKESAELGENGLSISSKTPKLKDEKPDVTTDRFGIISKKKTKIPSIGDPKETFKKIDSLLHDIDSLRSSEKFEESMSTMTDISEMAEGINALQEAIGDKPDLSSKEEVDAYNIRVQAFNSKRDEYMSREDEANDALSFLGTYDDYVSEYNELREKVKPDDQEKYYDPILLKQVAFYLKSKNPTWDEDKINAESKKAMEESGVMDDPDIGLTKNVGENLIKSAQSAITDLLPASIRAKAGMATGVLFKKYKTQLKSLEGKDDNLTVELSGLVGRGKKKYTVKRAKELLKERMVNSMALTIENLTEASAQMDEAAEKKLIQHIDQIDWSDPKSVASFAASSIGQAFGQIPLALISFGTSAEIMETGTTYIEGIEKIMEANPGITYEEILENDLDDAASAEAFGLLSGMLEFVGAKTVMKATGAQSVFKGVMRDNFGKRFLKGGVSEFGTEFAQSLVTQFGASKVARKSNIEAWEQIKFKDAFSEGISGLLGGGTISAIGGAFSKSSETNKQAIDQVREDIDIDNPEAIEAAAEELEVKINEELAKEEQKKVEKEIPAVEPEKITKPEEISEPVEYKIGEKKFNITVEDGNLVMLDEEGNEPTKYGKQKLTKQYQENFNYLEGEKAPEVQEAMNEEEAFMHIAKESNNPLEVAENWLYSSEATDVESDYKSSQIEEHLPSISRKSFINASDVANIGRNLAKRYFKKEGVGIDDAAQQLSETAGIDISVQDVVDFMLENPKGYKPVEISRMSTMLSNKFQDLTGLKLTPERAQLAIKQQLEKDVIDYENYLEQEYDNQQEAEKAYYDQITKGEIKQDIEDVSPAERIEKGKTKGEQLKEELEKDIEKKTPEGKPVKKKGKYIQRVLADERRVPEFKELLKEEEEYTQQDLDLAEKRSHKFIKDFQENFGEKEGLLEVSKILMADKKSEGFPEIMVGPISSELETLMEKLGMRDEALEVVSFKQKEARKGGRLLVGIRETSSPHEVISLMRKNIRTEKLEKINEEFKEGKTYNQALKEMQTKFAELEAAYKKLQKTGKIDESFLPEPDIVAKTPKSKELKARAKTLRKKGTDNLSAYFKSQRGVMPMGLMVDDKLITALGQILQSYILEFEGNVLAAYDKFKKDVAKNYEQISQEDIDKVKNDLLSQSEDVINEFKDKKKLQIINDILKPDTKETKEEASARKEASENILNDLNEGKSIEEVSDNLSELAKFDKIDPKVLDEILSLAVEHGNLLNEGKLELASTKFDELMDKLYGLGLENRAVNEVMMDLWYTSVLSGLTTVRRSLFGSGITSAVFTGFRFLATPSMAPIMWSQMVRGSKGLFQNYIHVLQTGKSNVQIQDFKIKRGSYSAMLWRTKHKDLSKLNAAVKSIWAIPTFMFRNIVAWDQILKNATSEANYALYEFENTSKGKTNKQRVKETEAKLRNDKDEEIQSIVQAEIEERKANGEKIESGYKFRRFTEIKNEYRDSEIIKRSMEDAAEAALVGTPKGTLGRIYKGVINKAEIKKDDTLKIKAGKTMFKFTFPFFRIGFNWINAGLDFTPIGLARGLSKQVWTKDGMIDRTSFQKRELIAKASTGMMLTTSIMLSMFDWDEEEGFVLKDEKDMWIRVYGPLTGDYKTIPDVSLDAKPWSIQLRNPISGEWTDPMVYQDNPIGFALAPIGIMHDEIYFNQLKKDKDEPIDERKTMFLLNGIGMGTFTYAMDKSFNQGINNLFKVVTADSINDMERSLKSLVLSPVEGFYPGIYNQGYAQYRSMIGKSEKQYREWYERLPSKIPLVDGIIKNDKVDVFGYPIIRDFDFPFIPDYILKLAKENLDYRENIKSWNLLHKYENVVLGRFKPPTRDKYKNKLTNQQMDEYMEIAGLRMRKYVEDHYDDLNQKDRKKLQEKFWEFKGKSATHAKSKISKKKN